MRNKAILTAALAALLGGTSLSANYVNHPTYDSYSAPYCADRSGHACFRRTACDPQCSSCCDLGSVWISAEYVAMKGEDRHIPALFVGSDTGSLVAFGNKGFDDLLHGGRLAAGFWLDSCEVMGVEVRWTYGENWIRYRSSSPFLGRSYIDEATGLVEVNPIAVSGFYQGKGAADLKHNLHLGEALLRYRLDCQCANLEVIMGYQMFYLSDKVTVFSDRIALVDQEELAETARTRVHRKDEYEARNVFHGATFGLNGMFDFCGWEFAVEPRIAFGYHFRNVDIEGETVATSLLEGSQEGPAVVEVFEGGLLALPTNIGNYDLGDFTFVPQIEFSLTHHITCRLRGKVGYFFTYLPDVLFAGNQIDLRINPSQLDGGNLNGFADPKYHSHKTNYHLSLFSIGLEYYF